METMDPPSSPSSPKKIKVEPQSDVIEGDYDGGVVLGLDSNLRQGDELNVTVTVPGGNETNESADKRGITVAGPTNPLALKRVQVLTPIRFCEEPLTLECEWQDCSFKTEFMHNFMDHVVSHVPIVKVVVKPNCDAMTVYLNCNWESCPWKTDKKSEDLQRHLYLHAYHMKLKCIGENTLKRSGVNPCRADPSNRNILPDLSENLLCAWGNCCEQFTNIQLYYNHINEHVDDTPRGKNVVGGINCSWRGCSSIFPNAVKLRDHMRSHTQEKLLACPTCGGLFANRTRFFDHCRRQVLLEDESFVCDVCMKCFSTARLLRDHIRSHVNTYKCPKCEMSCSSPSALNCHMKYKHSNDKPYTCQFCTYACKSYNDLVRHSKVHGGLLYKCEEEGCTFDCKAMTTLKSHWAKAHGDGESKYACHACDKKFFKGYYLTKHLVAVHKLQWPSGHSRFRYKLNEDGFYRLLAVRFESVEEQS